MPSTNENEIVIQRDQMETLLGLMRDVLLPGGSAPSESDSMSHVADVTRYEGTPHEVYLQAANEARRNFSPKFESGIPLPPSSRLELPKIDFEAMAVGDSVFVPALVDRYAGAQVPAPRHRFTSRPWIDGDVFGTRVWRIV